MFTLTYLLTNITYIASAMCWVVFGSSQHNIGRNERDLPKTSAPFEDDYNPV